MAVGLSALQRGRCSPHTGPEFRTGRVNARTEDVASEPVRGVGPQLERRAGAQVRQHHDVDQDVVVQMPEDVAEDRKDGPNYRRDVTSITRT